MVQLSNMWWRDTSKAGVAKNLLKRITWGLFNFFKTLKEHTVYIPIFLGVILLLFGLWLNSQADIGEQKVREPLIDLDTYIDRTIDGINMITQDVPPKLLEYLNTTFQVAEQLTNTIVTNTAVGAVGGINKLFGFSVGAMNSAIDFARQHGAGSAPSVPAYSITVPSISIDQYPSLPIAQLAQDLNAVRIPKRTFSCDREGSPFVKKVFDLPRKLADWSIIIGIVLIVYAGLRLLFALFVPLIPGISETKSKLGRCFKCLRLTGQGCGKATARLSQPMIFVPIVIGLLIMIIIEAYVVIEINTIHTDSRTPLMEADDKIADVIYQINNFTQAAPQIVVEGLNDAVSQINRAVSGFIRASLGNASVGINDLLLDVQNGINDILTDLGTRTFTPQQVNLASLGISPPVGLIPSIPNIDMSSIFINPRVFSLSNLINPWMDHQVNSMLQICQAIFYAGLIIAGVPFLVVFASFCRPFIPHSIEEFFSNPDFWKDEEGNTMVDLKSEDS